MTAGGAEDCSAAGHGREEEARRMYPEEEARQRGEFNALLGRREKKKVNEPAPGGRGRQLASKLTAAHAAQHAGRRKVPGAAKR